MVHLPIRQRKEEVYTNKKISRCEENWWENPLDHYLVEKEEEKPGGYRRSIMIARAFIRGFPFKLPSYPWLGAFYSSYSRSSESLYFYREGRFSRAGVSANVPWVDQPFPRTAFIYI